MEPERARILVVDDDPAVRQTFRQTLEREGHDVGEAGTGVEGLVAARDPWRHVVILDLMLPDLEGLEVLRELQGRERAGAVIIVTGHGNAAAGMEAARLGARAEIAYGLSFRTAQHFARVFRGHAGLSPGEYRARVKTPGNDAGGGQRLGPLQD